MGSPGFREISPKSPKDWLIIPRIVDLILARKVYPAAFRERHLYGMHFKPFDRKKGDFRTRNFVLTSELGRLGAVGGLQIDRKDHVAYVPYLAAAESGTGSGTQMLTFMEETAARAGATEIRLKPNMQSIEYYEKMGWERIVDGAGSPSPWFHKILPQESPIDNVHSGTNV